MNWWKIAARPPETLDPEAAGYDPAWGEHHGPVTFIPDRWNYGATGYPYKNPPMPLPKKLYHVTPFPKQIQEQGFKHFEDPKDQTFGGHGNYTSFSSKPNAEIYHKGLTTMYDIANGNLQWSEMPTIAKRWGVKAEAAQRIFNDVQRQAEVHKMSGHPMTEQAMMVEFLSKMGFLSDSDKFPNAPHFPLFFGTGKSLLERLKGMDGRDLAVMEADVPPGLNWHNGVNVFHGTDMKNNYTYNGSENEWRIWNPQHIPKENIRRVL